MPWYTIAWLAWGAFFLIVEGKALANKRDGDTLSEHVWRVFHVYDKRPTRLVIAARLTLGLFLFWLLAHMTMGWFTPSHLLPWLH